MFKMPNEEDKLRIENNYDFHNIICNDCPNRGFCRFPNLVSQLDFLIVRGCKHYKGAYKKALKKC